MEKNKPLVQNLLQMETPKVRDPIALLGKLGYNRQDEVSMKAKKISSFISVDNRGRLTLPAEIRKGVESYSLEVMKDGALKLIPQEVVSLADAALLRSLKKSIKQMKDGETEEIPKEWLR